MKNTKKYYSCFFSLMVIFIFIFSILPHNAFASRKKIRRHRHELNYELKFNNGSLNYCENIAWLDQFSSQNDQKIIPSTSIDRIVVRKDIKKLYLIQNQNVVKTYDVALGANPIGAKHEQGDKKTPEGFYNIDSKTTETHYHKALHINYPNDEDRAYAHAHHIDDPGDEILIHGFSQDKEKHDILAGLIPFFSQFAHPKYNWTNGCIAVTDPEIDEIYSVVDVGTIVEICPVN